MTSKELQEKVKKIKKIEKAIKLLKQSKKALMELYKVDFDSFRVLIPCETTFDDNIYYDVEDRIKQLETKISEIYKTI